MNLHLEIITPEKVVYKDEVSSITSPTTQGEITILPGHVGLLTTLAPGELTIKKGNSSTFLAVTSGFLEIIGNTVTVLADYAVRSEDIQVEKVKAAQERAKKLMEEKGTDEEIANARAIFTRTLLELKIAEKRRHHSRPLQ